MNEFYDPDGNPIGLMEWGRLFRQRDLDDDDSWWRRHSTIDDKCEVSTVWIGMNHNLGPGPPLIFETMIFGGPYDQQLARYASREVAWAGHASVVAALKTGKHPFPNR